VNATMFKGQKSARPARPGKNRIFDQPSGELKERGDYDRLTRFSHALLAKGRLSWHN
jgi:hypothetical protein